MRAVIAGILLTSVAWADWQWTEEGGWVSFSPAADGGGAPDLLKSAKRAYARDRLDDALLGFDAYLTHYRGGPGEAEALHLRAECLFRAARYLEAHEALSQVMARYPNYRDIRLVIEREYDIASALLSGAATGSVLGIDTYSEALGRQILEDLASNYEFEAFSDDALYLIAAYDFRQGRFREAMQGYERLLRRHPDSEWTGMCLFQQAQCHLALADAPDYDQTHALDALRLLRKYTTEYQGDLVKKAKDVLRALEETLAERDYKTAEFYLWEERPRAASVYFRSILREFPETKIAGEAGRQLKELEKAGKIPPLD